MTDDDASLSQQPVHLDLRGASNCNLKIPERNHARSQSIIPIVPITRQHSLSQLKLQYNGSRLMIIIIAHSELAQTTPPEALHQ